MEILRAQYESGIDLANKTLIGLVAGDAVVSSATSSVNGTIAGSLTINASSEVELNGMILGDVINHGTLNIRGVIHGKLINMPGAKYEIAIGALVKEIL